MQYIDKEQSASVHQHTIALSKPETLRTVKLLIALCETVKLLIGLCKQETPSTVKLLIAWCKPVMAMPQLRLLGHISHPAKR